ncbi:restriction endonuclease subunit S [Psychrosphaera haliotis]|uniref:Restriction endonuclease subunit S n=1 Tax=Psychrosphaera haliotis TaxID=555083 RepID=A0A6N8FDJ9_9GAMM|nr:restriction endonuclease subunit S [Psychrosphaera haliotis]MUH72802.1 restriction endonuclease subunit S [Psychrosphaera haliotis]
MNDLDSKVFFPELRFPEFQLLGGWQYTNANKLFKQVSNKNHNSDLPILAITQEYGAIPRELIDYNVTATEKSIKSYKVVDVGDFIISLRSFQGGIEYSTYKGICSPAYVVLRKTEGVNEEFFKHYFKTKRFIRDLTKNLEGLRDGKMISYKQFSEVFLPCPKPEEQKKVANFLSSLDGLIQSEIAKCDSLKMHKKGLEHKLFAKKAALPELRFAEFDGMWEESTVGQIATVKSGGTPNRSNSEYWEGDIPWVSTTLINFNLINEVNEFITKTGLDNSSAKIFPANTILMAMYGQGKTRGQVAKLGMDASINQACAALTLNKEVSTDFVYHSLAASYEEIRSISNDGGQKNLSATLIKKIPFYYPDVKTGEQQKISDCLSSVEKLILLQEEKVEALKSYKKGFVQKIFPSREEEYA